MPHLLKKLKLYTKLGPETYGPCKYSNQNLLVIISRLQEPTKLFLQLKHNTELLLHLHNQYHG